MAKCNMRPTPLFPSISENPPVSQIMIIQELYFQNYYNLGNPNRNPPGKTKCPTFQDGQIQHEAYSTFFHPFLENPGFPNYDNSGTLFPKLL